jgi:hypothetical protein
MNVSESVVQEIKCSGTPQWWCSGARPLGRTTTTCTSALRYIVHQLIALQKAVQHAARISRYQNISPFNLKEYHRGTN